MALVRVSSCSSSFRLMAVAMAAYVRQLTAKYARFLLLKVVVVTSWTRAVLRLDVAHLLMARTETCCGCQAAERRGWKAGCGLPGK